LSINAKKEKNLSRPSKKKERTNQEGGKSNENTRDSKIEEPSFNQDMVGGEGKSLETGAMAGIKKINPAKRFGPYNRENKTLRKEKKKKKEKKNSNGEKKKKR